MKSMRLSEIIEATGGSLQPAPGDDPLVSGISTDSRTVQPGELFIPIVGEQHDGHDFISAAFEQGAVASLSSCEQPPEPGRLLVKVADTLDALEDLALHHRKELPFAVVAITGSVGKTTTKEFLSSILGTEFTVAAAPKSFNNRLGVALTLLEADEETEHLVVEMGTSGKGELSYLSSRVRPERILITTVAEAHLQGLQTIAGVIEAKAEILEGLAEGGQVYLNPGVPGYDVFCSRLIREPRTFGNPEADFPLERGLPSGTAGIGQVFRVSDEEYSLELPGEHNVVNASGAIAIALDLGMSPGSIRRGLALCSLPPGRFNVQTGGDVVFVDDSYNANPCSMEAAFGTFADLCGEAVEGRNIAVLGEMRELGEGSQRYHEELGRRLAGFDMNILVTIGGDSRHLSEAFVQELQDLGRAEETTTVHFEDLSTAKGYLAAEIKPGDRVLFKASNAVGLSGLAGELRETAREAQRETPFV
jgi:UDP-N-acetylmuramoyl-tripeptide--D-alanyl-D-alanine ligase